MSKEILIDNISSNLPYIGIAVGAIAGGVAEHFALDNIAKNRAVLSTTLGDALTGPEAIDYKELEGRSLLKARASQALGKMATPLVLSGMAVGGMNGLAWAPTEDTRPPYLAVVVDQSGATMLSESSSQDGITVADSINTVVASLGENEGVDVTAYVASLGTVRSADPSEVASFSPGGNAPIPEAFNRAIESVSERWGQNVGTQPGQAGVVIVTNGNLPGDVAAITQEAQNKNVPIFVANVEAGAIAPEATQALKDIADQSGGEYWDVDSTDAEEMSKEIQKDLKDANFKDHRDNGKWPLRVLSAGLAGGVLALGYRNRADNTIGRDMMRSVGRPGTGKKNVPSNGRSSSSSNGLVGNEGLKSRIKSRRKG